MCASKEVKGKIMKLLKYTFSFSAILSSLSCPIMAVGIFGLLQHRPSTALWWGLIGISVIITLLTVRTHKSIDDNNEQIPNAKE
jgi:hypothetical protein